MKLSLLGWLLRYGGALLPGIVVLAWGVVAAFFGRFLVSRVEFWRREGYAPLEGAFHGMVFGIFLAISWLLAIGISLVRHMSFVEMIPWLAVVAALSFAVSWFIFFQWGVAEKFITDKFPVFFTLMSLVWVFSISSNESYVSVQAISPEERVKLLHIQLVEEKNNGKKKEIAERIKNYGKSVPSYYQVAAALQVLDYDEARTWLLFSNSKDMRSNFWEGVWYFSRGAYAEAGSYFDRDGETALALGAIITSSGAVSEKDFSRLSIYARRASAKIENDESLRLLISEIQRIELDNFVVKPINKDGVATFNTLETDRSYLKNLMHNAVLSAVLKQEPHPLSDQERKYLTSLMTNTSIMLLALFPAFLATLLWTTRILTDPVYGAGGPGTKSGCSGKFLKSALSKISRHSALADRIATRIALMEPNNEHGLFSVEIQKITSSVFPMDVFKALKYWAKAKIVLARKKRNDEEVEDLKFFWDEIRKLSGKLVPYGNEQVLGIISALRKRAEAAIAGFKKRSVSFVGSRSELITVYDELLILGDILDAGIARSEITKYHLLGLEPKSGHSDDMVRQAYRSIMSVIHPDKNPNNKFLAEIAKSVNAAYSVLGSESKRKIYDKAFKL